MPLTISQQINCGKISQYLSIRDITVKGLFGGGIDLSLPNKIYNITKSLEYWYNLDPTDETLTFVGNYLMAICGRYGLQAQNITGTGGTIAIITGSTFPTTYDFEVDASASFIIDGQSSITITSFIGYNLLFIRNNIPQSTVNQGGSYFSWTKQSGGFVCYPAAITGEIFTLIPTV